MSVRQSVARVSLLLATLVLGTHGANGQTHSVALNTGWKFHALEAPEHKNVEQWMPAAVPGVVQMDLRRAGVIPDPYFADNERALQWIGTTDWEYSDDFVADEATLHRRHAELVFEGLDTFADIWLNGRSLTHTDNIFRSWHIDVTGQLQRHNTLRIVFHSPVSTVAASAAKLPYIIPGTGYEPLDRAHGIYPTSQYVRKAGYSFGWDWAPRLITSGIWRPVHLDTWDDARITALHLHQSSVSAERAITEAEVKIDADRSLRGVLRITLTAPSGRTLPAVLQSVRLDAGANRFSVPIRVDHPQRWYPNGYGAQSLYTVRARLLVASRVLDSRTLHTGLRSVELRREPDQWGTSFAFVVNGIPIFAKGANFVPLDSFPPAVTPERRLKILTAARDAHMNMLRVWGGGYYESDDFYEDADRLGLMIWQDFMFGGSMIPHDAAYLESVGAEAREQVERLSDHPSLALWCGNNEVGSAWKSWGDRLEFKKEITPDQREEVWQDYLLVFYDILKSAVREHGNGVPYWPSTPQAEYGDEAQPSHSGDVHSWSVWSAGAPFTDYALETPRFLSEFGFQGMPDLRTVRAFAGNDEDIKSAALSDHERFQNGYARMQEYLAKEFREPRDFAAMDYLSQVLQGEAIKFAVETMRSRRPQNMGTLFWQFDDCWPAVSWSSIDYFLRPKALEFYARRFYAPLLIVASREKTLVRVSVVSDEMNPRAATLRWRLMRFDGTVVREASNVVTVQALASTSTAAVDLSEVAGFDAKQDVLAISLEDGEGKQLAMQNLYFAAAKELDLPQEEIAASVEKGIAQGEYTVILKATHLARAVELSFGQMDAEPEDNFFDLLPGEMRHVAVHSSASLTELQAALQLTTIASATR